MTITGDGRKVLETFIQYATAADNQEIADVMYYESDELRRRALELQRQLEALDDEGR